MTEEKPTKTSVRMYYARLSVDTVFIVPEDASEIFIRKEAFKAAAEEVGVSGFLEVDPKPIEVKSLSQLPIEWRKNCLPWKTGKINPEEKTIEKILNDNYVV